MSVHRPNFVRRQWERERGRSEHYSRYECASDPEEKVLALARAVLLEPYPDMLKELEEISDARIARAPTHPSGWYGLALAQLLKDDPEGYCSLQYVYDLREAGEQYSRLCLSVLLTMHMNEAVRDLTERFIESAIGEYCGDAQNFDLARTAAQVIEYDHELLEQKIEHQLQRARFANL